MRNPFQLTLLVLLLLISTTCAWQPVQAILNFFSRPLRVPQFVLDTRHPWLEQNKALLNRLDNTEQALCNLDSNLRPGNNSTWTYPTDLFKKLVIDNNRVGASKVQVGWAHADARLNEILRCPAALQDVEIFEVVIWISDGKYTSIPADSPVPPPALPGLFVKALSSMPNLKTLDWETFDNGIDEFRQTFTDHALILPTVHHMRLAKHMQFLVTVCPNVEILESGGSLTTRYWRDWSKSSPTLDLIQSARTLKKLSSLGLYGRLNLEHFEALTHAAPNVTDLQIDGELTRIYEDDSNGDYYDYKYEYMSSNVTLETYVSMLTRLPNLNDLRLPGSAGLHLGFDGGPGCGNAYFGAEGRKYGRSVSREDAETTERAAEIVLKALPNLKALNFGGHEARLMRRESGQVYAMWPWTDRMTEWTYEMWPEPSGASSEMWD